MHDDVSTYFALVYRRREPVLVMKRMKRKAMFRPSWKFEGEPNSISPQFFVFCFRVFLGDLGFRGLRFLGGLGFRGLRFLGGLGFRGLRFLGGLRFRGLRSLGGLPFQGRRFLGGLPFRGLRFLGGLPFRGLWSSVFGLRFLDTPSEVGRKGLPEEDQSRLPLTKELWTLGRSGYEMTRLEEIRPTAG